MGGHWNEKIETRFDRKYKNKGGSIVLKGMIINRATFERIGRYFGFSKQRAEQYCSSLGYFKGRRYIEKKEAPTKIQNSPYLMMKLRNLDKNGSVYKGRTGECIFKELFKSATFNGTHAHCDFSLNGFNVEIKLSNTPHCPDPNYPLNRYYRFTLSPAEFKSNIEYVFLITPSDYYLIPRHALVSRYTYITKKYDEFKVNPAKCFK